MAREIEHKEIDGVKYVCSMMPATKGHKVMIELVETIGRPALVGIATGLGNGDSTVDNVVDITSSLLMERLTPDNADRIVRIALQHTRSKSRTRIAGQVDRADQRAVDLA